MSGKITYKITGTHGSLTDLVWADVPAFAVVTGENGVGKTQLLEVLANAYGHQFLSPPRHRAFQPPPPRSIPASVFVDGSKLVPSTVFYADASWVPTESKSFSRDEIDQELRRLYEQAATPPVFLGKGGPLYDEWTGDWDAFVDRATPAMLAIADDKNRDLAFMFMAYSVLREHALERARASGADTGKAVAHLGTAPWEILDQFCREADIGFEMVPPNLASANFINRTPYRFEIQLKDIERDMVVPLSAASSGERIMLSVIFWRYFAESMGNPYQAIILDEPDAHLHPSLVRKFLNVIVSTLVERHGARVIITTHSPSTVALAPAGSVFELRRNGVPRISAVENAAALVAKLTGGLVAVDSATKFVVLEGQTDMPFYRDLWVLMVEAGLPSFPGIAFFKRDGCTKVREAVRFLRDWEFGRFFGLLDRDAPPHQNEPAEGVFVLSRNGVENYLFDPLNIWLCLWLRNPGMHRELYQIASLRKGNGAQLKTQPVASLQAATDSVWRKVRPTLGEIDARMEENVDVSYVGGLTLKYPRWFIESDDHEMASSVRKAFNPFPFHEPHVRESFMTLNLISTDLWNIFESIATVSRTG
ncbi:hypothetical protein R69608_07650 [Paraburkholderia nemoris]|uniref:AAA family ATPase n=1 Tax=Paraburkholderia nemoris TaxID=2793076 RepID=UPI001912073E|nr:ATP-binding protein [Paraburkholderia nemoris]MBK5153171.1 ATP-binding protein [Burkholderia sp. R-69608]CAE6971637.1 hypothetical protein R69608_07650 [Paraburkholderia nemoris]